MLKWTYDFTARRLETFWTGTTLAPIPFLISTSWFLILTNVSQNGSVITCSTACPGAAEMNDMGGYRNVP